MSTGKNLGLKVGVHMHQHVCGVKGGKGAAWQVDEGELENVKAGEIEMYMCASYTGLPHWAALQFH